MESHFARLRLLDPNRFHDFETFVAEQQKYQPVADAVTLLLDRAPLTKDQQNAIHDLIAEQDIEPLLKAANTDSEDGENARRELISMLMDRHGTSRLLFRNTRNGVKGFPRRELKAIKMPLPAQYQTAIKVAGIMGSKTTEIKAREMLYPEQIYQEFEGENATGGTSIRVLNGCSASCWQTAMKSAGNLCPGRNRSAAGAGSARARRHPRCGFP